MGRPAKNTKRRVATKRKSVKKQSAFKRKSRFVLPWPYIFLVLLSVGVLLAGWTFQAGAANINVTARIPAPLPTDPAIITSPVNDDRFSAIPITVQGTCPLDSYVNIYTNNFYRGSTICQPDNTFQLDIDLFPGANTLKAKVFNITDDEGPQSDTVLVYYDAPTPPPPPPTPPPPAPAPHPTSPPPSSGGSKSLSGGKSQTKPFSLETNFKYRGYSVGQTVKWKLEIAGGLKPYALNVDWGDGKSSVISKDKAGVFVIEHQYKSKGEGYKNSYTIKISASDNSGTRANLQLFVIVNPSALGSVVATTIPPKPPLSDNWLIVAWPAYIVVLLMFVTFWLGEKEELIKLKKQGLLRQRRT